MVKLCFNSIFYVPDLRELMFTLTNIINRTRKEDLIDFKKKLAHVFITISFRYGTGRLILWSHDFPDYQQHDDVIKWKHFPRYWPFARGIHRSPVNSPHKGQWRGVLMISLICDWINGWVNNGEAGGLRRHRAPYDVTVMHKQAHRDNVLFDTQ